MNFFGYAIAAQIVAILLFGYSWALPTARDKAGLSKDLLHVSSFLLISAQRDDREEIVMSGGMTPTGEPRFWHTRWSAPLPLTGGARIYLQRMNEYSRQRYGYLF